MMDESSRSNMSVDGDCIYNPPSTKQYKLSNNENGENGIAIQKPLEDNSDLILRHKEASTDDSNSNI